MMIVILKILQISIILTTMLSVDPYHFNLPRDKLYCLRECVHNSSGISVELIA